MLRILVVDDEKDFARMVKFNLEEFGKYEVRIVNSPDDVLSMAIDYKPNLILLDVIMPGMEGPDVCAQIRRNKDLKSIPIIFLTATVTKDEVDTHKGEIGGHRFLAKGGSIAELKHCIEQMLAATSD